MQTCRVSVMDHTHPFAQTRMPTHTGSRDKDRHRDGDRQTPAHVLFCLLWTATHFRS